MPDYPKILREHAIPKPPGGEILDMRRSMSTYCWYAETDLGWFWLDELNPTPEWQFCPNGPPYNRGA